jgi:ubiquinone/menaquinone biosynthesis C-methylase UbiE
MDALKIKEEVRRHYAESVELGGCGCGSCCSDASGVILPEDIKVAAEAIPPGSDLGLSCGLPTRSADLRNGETVLDLGSGAGVDVFRAVLDVGPAGRVIGIDMTPEMIARARSLAAERGYTNVEFRLGEIESLPVESASVDVVLSNCVLNLVPDKARAFAEMHRVLRPGGRFVVSDIVSRGEVPDSIRNDSVLWAGCVAGAIDEAQYLQGLRQVGFQDIEVLESRTYEASDDVYEFLSITVRGWKR